MGAGGQAISIITVCYNSEEYIDKCISSVIEQGYSHIEYIIIDGGSNDHTLDIINKYSACISKIVSEPDSGIYNAMNKGLALVTGDVVFFLNSDDYFVDSAVVSDIMKYFDGNDAVELIYGDQVRSDGINRQYIYQPDSIGRRSLCRRTIQHQTLFARRSVFSRVGGFDESLRIVADYKWLLEAFLVQKCDYMHIPRVITNMSSLGASGSTNFEPERRIVMKDYFHPVEIFFYRTVPLALSRLWRSVIKIKPGA